MLPNRIPTPRPDSAGNAIVIVLILIALLAALTLTMTRMGSNTNDVSQEQAQVIASQVLRQGRSMANAVDGLLGKGCSINQLSFENSIVTGYLNAQSTSDKSCWLFDQAGAGMIFPSVPTNANDGTNWFFAANNSVLGVGKERETGNTCPGQCEDLLMILPLMNLNVCRAINFSVGLKPSFVSTPPLNQSTLDLQQKYNAPSAATTRFNYSDNAATTGIIVRTTLTPPNSSEMWDKKTGCFESNYKNASGTTISGSGMYFFYQVLLER